MSTITNICRSERQQQQRQLAADDLPATWDTMGAYKKELYKFVFDFIGSDASSTGKSAKSLYFHTQNFDTMRSFHPTIFQSQIRCKNCNSGQDCR